MTSADLKFFGSLSPVEAAVLWFSGAPVVSETRGYEAMVAVNARRVQVSLPVPDTSRQSLRVAISKETLVLAAGLAASYVERDGAQMAGERTTALVNHANEVIVRGAQRPLVLPNPHDEMIKLVGRLKESQLLVFGGTPDNFLEGLRDQCVAAAGRLEQRGLVEDPPWKSITAGSALMVLLGITPVNFAVRTERGEDVVRTIQVEAPLWDFKHVESKHEESWQVNFRAVDWAGDTLSELAEQYLRQWKQHHGGRLPDVSNETPKLD